MRKTVTSTDEDMIRELWDSDLTLKQIGERVGHCSSCLLYTAARLGLPKRPFRPGRRPKKQNLIDEVKILRSQGKVYREIAAETGFSITYVQRLGSASCL